jgi:CheY-like chemotaxis protein
VLVNLCVNARDAMPRGGRLTIATRVGEFTEPARRGAPDCAPGCYAVLSVSDTGCGIDPAVQACLFEPFVTTKEPGRGTGLGLASVYGIVKQHRGWIEVDSAPGAGTTFRVLLPLDRDPVPALTPSRPRSDAAGGTETVLVVEDEASVRRLAIVSLKRFGYRVLEAGNGRDALALWKTHRDEIDLLFTDIVMPDGISGIELTRRLRDEKPGLKVILSSGYSAEIATQGLPADAGVMLLSKPYTIGSLAETVRRCLDDESFPVTA